MRRRRFLLLAALATAGAAGCADDSDERATATCFSALERELDLVEGDTGVFSSGMDLTESGDGWRVGGSWEHRTLGEGRFTCDVVPDADDALRGMRVTAIDVQRSPEPAQPQ